MYMRLKDGKRKVLTLSYDDGVVQDKRLIELMDKYGIKGTFNINSGRYAPEDKIRERYYGRMKLSEAKALYINSGHEVAIHGFTHPFLEKLRPEQIVAEITEDRKNISKEYKTLARGMAYPYGTYNDEVIQCLKMCGVCYSRTTKSTEKFVFPENWLELHPTCHHKNPRLMELAKDFAEGEIRFSTHNWMFYLWGHSYEFEVNDNWEIIEEFCEYIGNREDIWYATNIEIYDYIMAYNSLQTDMEEKIIHNPSAIDVWFMKNDIEYCVKSGETIYI